MKLLLILLAASIIAFPVTYVDPIAAAWAFVITLFFGLSVTRDK